MKVFVAREPFIGSADDGYWINVWTLRVVLESHPAYRRWPEKWKLAGTINADNARWIDILGDAATLPKLMDRITPPASETDEAVRDVRRTRPAGPERMATLADVEAVRDALEAEGKPAGHRSIATAGGWSASTVRRRLAGN